MDFTLWLIIGIFTICMVGVGSSFLALALTGVPVVRTPIKVIKKIKSHLGIKKDDVIVDAGCADARAIVELCKGTGARGRGFELNGPMWLIGFFRVMLSGSVFSVRVYWKNFFRAELEDVDMVFCYLMPGSMVRVAKKCHEEMNEGTNLVSYLWSVPTWEPEEILWIGPMKDPVYIYKIGDNPAPTNLDQIIEEKDFSQKKNQQTKA